jgi:hypothetical protein
MQLRKGMWVVDAAGRVGIFTTARRLIDPMNPQLGFAEFPELHLTDSSGETTLIVTPDVDAIAGLRQALAAEIPAVRVAHLTPAALAAFGYE